MPITHWISRNFPFSHEGFRGRLQISFHQIVININIKPTNIIKKTINFQFPEAQQILKEFKQILQTRTFYPLPNYSAPCF